MAATLTEPRDGVFLEVDAGSNVREDRGFGERDRESALGRIVGAREHGRRAPEEANQPRLGDEIGLGRTPGRSAEEQGLVLGAVEGELRRSDGVDGIALAPGSRDQGDIGDEPNAAHDGSRPDGSSIGLVVEGDVAGDDRNPKRFACEGDALDRFAELPGDLLLLGIPEVEAIRCRERTTACARDVSRRFESCERAARARVERGDPPSTVERDREAARGRPQPQDGCVESGTPDGARTNEVVVLAVDRRATAHVRRPEQVEELLRRRRDRTVGDRFLELASPRLDAVAGRLLGQERDRDLAHDLVLEERSQEARLGHNADRRALELPLLADGCDPLQAVGDADHALLALRDDDLDRSEVGLSQGNTIEVDVDADLPATGHLGEGGGKAGSAEVLKPFHQAALHELEAGLDQLLPGERIADLNGRPLVLVLVGELLAGEDARPADAVASGRRTEEDDEVAGPRRPGAHHALRRDEAHAHGVDQRVLRVLLRKEGVSSDGGHAHAVAVVADAGDGAAEGEVGLAEAQPVEERHRTRTHGGHIPEDAADSRRRALEGLDRRRMIMALYLERDRLTFAEVDDTCVLAGPLEHARAVARETLQQEGRMLVAAMLRPEEGKNRQLELVRRATQQTPD